MVARKIEQGRVSENHQLQKLRSLSLTLSIGMLLLLAACFVGWQARAGTVDAAQHQDEARALEAGKPVDQQLAGGQAHVYQVTLAAGQYLHVLVEQQGVDVLVKVSGPDGKPLLEVDRPIGPQGQEPVSLVATVAGAYKLEVRAAEKGAPAGRYQIRVAELRAATAQDADRISAERAFLEGEKLQAEATADTLAQAIKKYDEALRLWRSLGERPRQADTLYYLGSIYESQGNRQKAIDAYYTPALALARELHDQAKEGDLLTNIGKALDELGEKQKALGYYEQSLALYRTLKSASGEATTLNNIGKVYDDLGQKEKALELYNRALPIFQTLKDRNSEAVTLNNIGGVYDAKYDSKDEHQRALDFYNRALPLFQAAQDQGGEATVLNNLGKYYDDAGDKEKAFGFYERALKLYRALGDRPREGNTLSNIGGLYDAWDKRQEAIDTYGRALVISQEVGDRRVTVYTLAKQGRLYDRMADDELAKCEEAANDKAKADECQKRGLAYKAKALEYYNQALPITRALSDRLVEAYTLTNIGKIYDDMGDNRKGLDYYSQALPLHLALNDDPGEAFTRYHIARVQRDLGNLTEARSQIVAAVNIVELLRTMYESHQQLRALYFAAVQNYYELYIDLLMQLHKQRPSEGNDLKALQISERARARSLLESLAEAGAKIQRGADPALLERQQLIQQQIRGKTERQLRLLAGSYTEAQAAAIKAEINGLKEAYQRVEAEMRARSPHYAALTQPQPLSAAEIQQQAVNKDSLLLEFSLGRLRSYLWAVTPTSVESFELPPRRIIQAAARKYYELLAGITPANGAAADRGLSVNSPEIRNPELTQAAAALSQLLLTPVAGELEKKRLLIVADGVLQYIPFAALPAPQAIAAGGRSPAGDKGQPTADLPPLVVDHEIVYLPSASTLAVLRKELAGRKPAPRSVAAIADPVFDPNDERVSAAAGRAASRSQPAASNQRALTVKVQKAASGTGWEVEGGLMIPRLPGTRKEAEKILAFDQPGQSLQALDFKASVATVSSPDLSQYKYIHLATHGFLNSVDPELSGLVLSLVDEKGQPQNGFLLVNDVYNLNLPAEMVVLSACKTGLGREVKGEGIIGLTRGLMYAGAARVVVSLWDVDDEATAQLMTGFYKGVLKDGLQPAAALRAAQVEMWKQKRYQSPSYWAAFILQGEWQ